MLKYLSITFLMIMMGFYSICYSQQWISTYQGTFRGDASATNEAHDIALGSGNAVYITGFITDTSGNADMCIIKYGYYGNQLWASTYNGPGNGEDKAYAITVDPVGYDAFITGYSTGINNTTAITTIRYNRYNGDSVWTATYADTNYTDSKAYAISVDAAGNVIVAGYGISTATGKDIIVIKYNSTNGATIWTAKYQGPYDDMANALSVDNENNIIVAGYTSNSSSPGSEDYITIKYNSDGVQQWVKIYNGPGNGTDIVKAMVTDTYGNVYITGYSKGDNCGLDYCTIKYHASGQQSWCSRYDGPGNSDDIANAMVLASPYTNNIIVTGSSRSGSSEGTEDYLTIKYNSYDGNAMWVSRYNGTGNNSDIAYSLAVSPSHCSVYVTGTSRHGIPEETADMVTIKYNIFNGSYLDTATFNGTADKQDVAFVVKVTSQNNVVVTGYTVNGGDMMSNQTTILTMGYGSDMFTPDESISEIPSRFKLYQNYPNPFNPSTTIKFDIGKPVNVKISVYDMIGREVSVPVNTYCNAGSYEVKFNVQNLATGVYFYELTAGTFRDVKKMILMK